MPAVPGIGDQEIHVDVVVVVAVAAWSEHGIEFRAGAGEHRLAGKPVRAASPATKP